MLVRAYRVGGLGATGAEAAQASVGTGVTIATTVAGGIATGASTAAIAIPVVGAAVALALGLYLSRRGPMQKVQTSNIANQIESNLKANLNAWKSLDPNMKYRSVQAQALAAFDEEWNRLVAACSSSQYGEPGQRCINDRNRGSTHVWPNGERGDWFMWYRDPIANDPQVKEDTITSSIETTVGQLIPGVDSDLLIALAIFGVVVAMS